MTVIISNIPGGPPMTNKALRPFEQAIAEVISEGKIRTHDMGGSNSTIEMAKAVAERL